jgi:hypothetical protein
MPSQRGFRSATGSEAKVETMTSRLCVHACPRQTKRPQLCGCRGQVRYTLHCPEGAHGTPEGRAILQEMTVARYSLDSYLTDTMLYARRTVADGYVVKIKSSRAPDLDEIWYAAISNPAEAMVAVCNAANLTAAITVVIDGPLTAERLKDLSLKSGQVRPA